MIDFEEMTQEQAWLKNLVHYNPGNGEFTRLAAASNVPAGLAKPRPSVNGYLRMRLDGRLYYLHRLAWLYENGKWPDDSVDHIDGDRTNNAIANLREATYAQNLQNRELKSVAVSGLRGAYFDIKSKRWQSKIRHNYKSISLGYYATAEEAHKAYLEGKRKYHKFNPEFTR